MLVQEMKVCCTEQQRFKAWEQHTVCERPRIRKNQTKNYFPALLKKWRNLVRACLSGLKNQNRQRPQRRGEIAEHCGHEPEISLACPDGTARKTSYAPMVRPS